MINKPVLIFAIIYLISIKIHAQDVLYLDKDQPAGNGSIHDLHWIVGYWSGTGLGGVCEELWLPALDNSMVGTFRFMMDRKLIFSEYMNMLGENGTLALKIKHFNKDLTLGRKRIEPLSSSSGPKAKQLISVGLLFIGRMK